MAEKHYTAPETVMAGGDDAPINPRSLKQVSVPVETLLGATNGMIAGAAASTAVSLVATLGQQGRPNYWQTAARNLTSLKGHGASMLAGIAAFAGLGAVVRYSRATKHNEWSDKHYAHMERIEAHGDLASRSHAERLADEPKRDTGEKVAGR